MSQSKKHSAFEAVTNVVIGYVINVIANMVILPLFGVDVSVSQTLGISICFTAISLARSYVLRRIFNKIKS